MSQVSGFTNGDLPSHRIDFAPASGQVIRTGGRAAAQIAASSEVENTITETAFDQTNVLKAKTLRAGAAIHIRSFGTVVDNNSTDTLTIRYKISDGTTTTTLVTTAAIDVADNDIFMADIVVSVRTAGSSGTAVASCMYQDPDAAGTAPKFSVVQSFSLDTTADITISATAEWSVAHADNEVRLDQLTSWVD